MPSLKSIQSGTAVIAAGSTTTTVSLGSSITASKAFLRHSAKVDTGGAQDSGRGAISGYITSTQAIFSRNISGSASDVTIKWFIVEYSSGVSVTRGSYAGANATTPDISLGTTVNLSKSWAQCSTQGNYSYDYGGRETVSASLPDTTHIRLRAVTDSGTYAVTYWEVIEYDTAVVLSLFNGTVTSAMGLSGTISLGTTVDTTKTVIFGNAYNSVSGFGSSRYELTWNLSSTVINWQRSAAYQDRTYYFQVVTLPEVSVQRNTATMAPSQSSINVSLGAALTDTSKAFIILMSENNVYSRCLGSDIDLSKALWTASILSTTTIELSRAMSGGSYSFVNNWTVIEYLPDGMMPDLTLFLAAMN